MCRNESFFHYSSFHQFIENSVFTQSGEVKTSKNTGAIKIIDLLLHPSKKIHSIFLGNLHVLITCVLSMHNDVLLTHTHTHTHTRKISRQLKVSCRCVDVRRFINSIDMAAWRQDQTLDIRRKQQFDKHGSSNLNKFATKQIL